VNSSLLIVHPSTCKEERNHIFRVVFGEFLGLSYECRESLRDEVQIQLVDAPQAGILSWPDVFFQRCSDEWLTLASLPTFLPVWDVARDLPEAKVVEPTIPVIYGRPLEDGTWFNHKGKAIRLGLDIAGSAFFMLSRYEEAVLPDRDEHGRFPARASLAYREGFLGRPIVDEYVEIVWACMKRLWPGLERKQCQYQVCLSHDVDHPLGSVGKSWIRVVKSAGGDVIRRKDLGLAARRLGARLMCNPDIDPNNTFDFIMEVSERHGIKSRFYFKAGSSDHRFDEPYNLEMPWLQRLMYRIHERGHEIGIHPSYNTYKNRDAFLAEVQTLRRITERLGIAQEEWGGRQHYLRWENPTTWQIWEDAGLDYDATLGFADHIGFRCGTCHEFPVFNLKTRKILRLRERPLIVMDATLLAPQYMALRPGQALERIERLSSICRRFGGTFSLLWHNNSLVEPWQREFYLEVVGMAVR